MMLTFRYDSATVDWLAEVHRIGGWHGGAARWMSATLLDAKYENSRWRHDGGALADIGPHVFDLLDAALGPVTDVLTAHFADAGRRLARPARPRRRRDEHRHAHHAHPGRPADHRLRRVRRERLPPVRRGR